MDLAREIYVVTQNFPREEVYGLVLPFTHK